MARHRMNPHPEQKGVAGDSPAFSAVWSPDQRGFVRLRRRPVGMARTQMLSVATLTPLVLACTVSGTARQFPAPTVASPVASVVSVALVEPAASTRPGPAVVAAERSPARLHIARGDHARPAACCGGQVA